MTFYRSIGSYFLLKFNQNQVVDLKGEQCPLKSNFGTEHSTLLNYSNNVYLVLSN